jgi:hypothetical protein
MVKSSRHVRAGCPANESKYFSGAYHHQVHVERKLRQAAQGVDDRSRQTSGSHELAIHDVDMNPVRATGFAARDVVGEAGRSRR